MRSCSTALARASCCCRVSLRMVRRSARWRTGSGSTSSRMCRCVSPSGTSSGVPARKPTPRDGTSTACVRDGMSGSGQERTSSPHRTACARTMRRNSSARPQPSSSRYMRAQCAAIVSGKKIRPSHVMALKNSRSHRPGSVPLPGAPNSRAQTLFARRRAASRSSG